ncbi:MAG: Jag N-terminal domain-containing protein [Dehalococcoidales bacterium]|nr:Jag N-terminal domain-containing protein [Dehalococcoidales bacterium]
MMENLEISARTVEEATRIALTRLNVGLDEVEIIILSEGKSGLFGFGAEDARISVRCLDSSQDTSQDTIDIAKDVLENILSMLGINAAVQVVTPQSIRQQTVDDTHTVILNIEGAEAESLIGRKGTTIEAIQYLVRLITARRTKLKIPIMIDVQSYKQRRYNDLRTLAINVALQVKSRKSSCRLEPMSAYERRIIHLSLADDPDVTTESVGEGDSRKVVVLPVNRK